MSLSDEIHVLFECPSFNTSRESFVGLANDIHFGGMSDPIKYGWLLNCEVEKTMKNLPKYVHLNLNK